MRPAAGIQIRWGIASAVLALTVLSVMALAPDPFFRQRLFTTTVDDVNMVTPGLPIYFRGAAFGSVRAVRFDPAQDNYRLVLGVRRDWRPSPCSIARVHETNPFAAPRVEIVSPGAGDLPAACAAWRVAEGCAVMATPASEQRPLAGCRRGPGLFETAAAAVAEAASVAKVANAMALQLQTMAKPFAKGGGGSGFDMAKTSQQLTATLASIDAMTGRLNASLEPGRGDIARTLQNVRSATDSANLAKLTQTVDEAHTAVAQMNKLVAANQANLTLLLQNSAAASTDTHALIEGMSASLTSTSGNLNRATDALDALSERLSADPTYVLHGQKFANPPPPGGRP